LDVFENQKAEIVGVLKDFNFTSLQSKIDAMMFRVVKDTTSLNSLYLRLSPKANFQQKIAAIEKIYKKYDSDAPFEYYFLDEAFNKQYRAEERMGYLFSGFTGIAIFIACMGLFGLITFTAEQKTKEIGIRKVLGASAVDMVTLLSKDFLGLVLISNVIAFPIAYYIIHRWLQDFAYQTDVSADIFILAGVLAIVIALLTVIVQATKAALVNPVKSLKSE
jgi:putative ABC transport system permease protein